MRIAIVQECLLVLADEDKREVEREILALDIQEKDTEYEFPLFICQVTDWEQVSKVRTVPYVCNIMNYVVDALVRCSESLGICSDEDLENWEKVLFCVVSSLRCRVQCKDRIDCINQYGCRVFRKLNEIAGKFGLYTTVADSLEKAAMAFVNDGTDFYNIQRVNGLEKTQEPRGIICSRNVYNCLSDGEVLFSIDEEVEVHPGDVLRNNNGAYYTVVSGDRKEMVFLNRENMILTAINVCFFWKICQDGSKKKVIEWSYSK